MSKQRESNFELLRIICIFGITLMHAFSLVSGEISGFNLYSEIVTESIFNLCVSIFIIISGYFGINFSAERLFKLWITVIEYSIFNYFFNVFVFRIDVWSITSLIKAFMPITTRKYWFIACYIMLYFLSYYINILLEKISKTKFEFLLIINIYIFCIMPTFFEISNMRDNGKGLMNFILMYMIGRYIRMYGGDFNNVKKYIGILISTVLLTICFNIIYYIRLDSGSYFPFSKDNSIFIFIGSICVFCVFKNMHFKIKIVNKMATFVFSTYMLDSFSRNLLNTFFHIENYSGSKKLMLYLIGFSFLQLLLSAFIEIIRKYSVGRFEKNLYKYICKLLNFCKAYCNIVR